jgi:hypothetical protein
MIKVCFPTLDDLLREAGEEVRLVTIRSTRSAKFSSGGSLPMTSFQVCVTARLDGGSIGEYICQVGEEVSYFNDQIRKLAEKALQMEGDIRQEIEVSGKEVRPGRYVRPEDTVYGSKVKGM